MTDCWLSFLEIDSERGGRKEEDLYGPGSTWRILRALQGSYLRLLESHLGKWEQHPPHAGS